MSDRVPCIVPGCTRSMGRATYIKRFKCEPGTLICGPHWRMVPKRLKRIDAKHRRDERKYGFLLRPDRYARLWDVIMDLFERPG